MTEETKVVKRFKSFVLGKCQCGRCNEDIPIMSARKVIMKYKKGHYPKGKDSSSYKEGVRHSGLYRAILRHDHPNAPENGYVLEHRLIYEHYLKILFDEDIYIPKEIDIHHIIPVKEGGTNAFINLEPKTRKEHKSHHLIDMSKRRCIICGTNKTKLQKHGDLIRPAWYGNKKRGFKCSKCYYEDPIVKERTRQRRIERQSLKINTFMLIEN